MPVWRIYSVQSAKRKASIARVGKAIEMRCTNGSNRPSKENPLW